MGLTYNDDLVVKDVKISHFQSYAEDASLKYLGEYASDLPISNSHGFIEFEHCYFGHDHMDHDFIECLALFGHENKVNIKVIRCNFHQVKTAGTHHSRQPNF